MVETFKLPDMFALALPGLGTGTAQLTLGGAGEFFAPAFLEYVTISYCSLHLFRECNIGYRELDTHQT